MSHLEIQNAREISYCSAKYESYTTKKSHQTNWVTV